MPAHQTHDEVSVWGGVGRDTNVLLRTLVEQFPESEACREMVEAQWDADIDLWISRQVIRELLVQLTHPRTLTIPLTGEEVLARLQTVLTLFRVSDETSATTDTLLMLLREYSVSGKQVHDANIVAVMLANGIDTLLTLNTADFRRYEDGLRCWRRVWSDCATVADYANLKLVVDAMLG